MDVDNFSTALPGDDAGNVHEWKLKDVSSKYDPSCLVTRFRIRHGMSSDLFDFVTSDLYHYSRESAPFSEKYVYGLGQFRHRCVPCIDLQKFGFFEEKIGRKSFSLTNVTIDLKNITDTDNDYTMNFICMYDNYVLDLEKKRYKYLDNVDQLIPKLEKM